MRTFAVLAALLGLFALSVWFAVDTWTSAEGPPMPAIGWIALAGGVLFSFLIGSGLMALVFYSARHGYDEATGNHDSKPRE